MVDINDCLELKLEVKEVLEAIKKAKEHTFIDNLRNRNNNVQFDSKIRGYIGEIALKKWFEKNNIYFEEINTNEDGTEIDIDFLYVNNGKRTNIELKTSLIPDSFINLDNTLKKADIKLIKRNSDNINNLKGDIHIQIYFTCFLRKKRDIFLKNLDIDLEKADLGEIYAKFDCDKYLNKTIAVAWIDKVTLINQIESKKLEGKKTTWSYAMREFWSCNLHNDAKPIKRLINYIKEEL